MQTIFFEQVSGSVASLDLDDAPARKLAALYGIRNDLVRVRTCALRIAEELDEKSPPNFDLIEGLTWQLVILYVRCFDSASAGRATNLVTGQLDRLSELQRQMHQSLLNIRHQAFAHSGVATEHAMELHLLENGQMHIAFRQQAPGRINDREQALLVVDLVDAVMTDIRPKADGLLQHLTGVIEQDFEGYRARLLTRSGQHSNPMTAALSFFAKLDSKDQSQAAGEERE